MSKIHPSVPRHLGPRGASRGILNGSETLGRYTDPRGRERELVRHTGAAESTLVIDRLAYTLGDQRLVAHLAADEPSENARIVASLYLAHADGGRCRRLTPEDLETAPFATQESYAATAPEDPMGASGGELTDERGCIYRLEAACRRGSIHELRWWRHRKCGAQGPPEVLTVRAVIGSLENYEPVRALTAQALAEYQRNPRVSVATLDAELHRVYASRVVLNRALREAVLAAVRDDELTMSEIAIRCGRFRRDPNGWAIGETSWLGRRIGILCESGKSSPTPWVSSDVLALIARRGLGIAPREVELG
jgi:hypothetical protein